MQNVEDAKAEFETITRRIKAELERFSFVQVFFLKKKKKRKKDGISWFLT